jgi:hypothetical protein
VARAPDDDPLELVLLELRRCALRGECSVACTDARTPALPERILRRLLLVLSGGARPDEGPESTFLCCSMVGFGKETGDVGDQARQQKSSFIPGYM